MGDEGVSENSQSGQKADGRRAKTQKMRLAREGAKTGMSNLNALPLGAGQGGWQAHWFFHLLNAHQLRF
jgi:hypothetical protein